MPTVFFDSFPAEERARVERVLERARLTARDVMITKAVFASTRMPGSIREMVTFVHGPVSRTYVCSAHGDWLELLAADIAREAVRRARMKFASRSTSQVSRANAESAPEDLLQARSPAVAPKSTRLLHGAAIRQDDDEVPRSDPGSSCAKRTGFVRVAGRDSE